MKIKTHGKIILIGEHSVVYGQPAIAIPFMDRELELRIEDSDENYLSSDFYNGKIKDLDGRLLGFKKLIKTFTDKYKISDKVKIMIKSDIPLQRGMGSSASIAVAIAKGLYEYFKIDYDIDKIIDLANISEKYVHGNPSGIDIETIARDRAIWYIKNKETIDFPIDLDGYLVISDSGIKGSTKEAVADVRALYDSDDKYKSYVESLGELTFSAKQAIKENNLKSLGEIMDKAQVYLRELSVSDPIIEEMIRLSKDAGALGAKLTGGGRGGCMIALSPDIKTAEKIKEKLKALGKEVWISDLKKLKEE
ncbi:mevalonate kinase [uncultured Helcococcus sp.]|uniref:mevalonate kinase n=1 Tax=uncultured Helcococcus sp. TaxID=1072508 RepID=UPI00260F971F|nr:mevalonate kinase [uncultured Helcococcus sp.]